MLTHCPSGGHPCLSSAPIGLWGDGSRALRPGVSHAGYQLGPSDFLTLNLLKMPWKVWLFTLIWELSCPFYREFRLVYKTWFCVCLWIYIHSLGGKCVFQKSTSDIHGVLNHDWLIHPCSGNIYQNPGPSNGKGPHRSSDLCASSFRWRSQGLWRGSNLCRFL